MKTILLTIKQNISFLPYKGRFGEVLGGVALLPLLFLLWGISIAFVSCNDDSVNNKYCSLPARFTFTPVNSISQLYSSCESLGEWCTITTSGTHFLFTKACGSQGEWPLTKLDGYNNFYMGLSGFIVGKPNIPEVGEDYAVVTCYDLACRNCYDDLGITRSMKLLESGYATCSRCQRTYNLNNAGQVSQGEKGQSLYRYRVYYGNNTLSINNK